MRASTMAYLLIHTRGFPREAPRGGDAMPDNTQIQDLLARLHNTLDEIDLAKHSLGSTLSTIAEQADALQTDAKALAALRAPDAPDVVFEALWDLTEEFERMRAALDTHLLDIREAIRAIEDDVTHNT
jgi:hypothetical protein